MNQRLRLIGDPSPEVVIPVSKDDLHVSRVFNVDDSADTQEALDEFLKEVSKKRGRTMTMKNKKMLEEVLTPEELRTFLKFWLWVISAGIVFLMIYTAVWLVTLLR